MLGYVFEFEPVVELVNLVDRGVSVDVYIDRFSDFQISMPSKYTQFYLTFHDVAHFDDLFLLPIIALFPAELNSVNGRQ